MRTPALALAAVLLAAGCGGIESQGFPSASAASPPGETLQALLDRPGPDVLLTQGTSDYAAGAVRLSFLVIRESGAPASRPHARVWVGTALRATPLVRASASLEPVGVPGVSAPAIGEVTRLYVAHFRLARPGKYWVVVEPLGARPPVQAVGNLVVKATSAAPAVGSKAIPSPTPTIASTHGNIASLTTRTPPDRELLRYSVAASLAAHKPFVLVFATPKFCSSRTCGPVVDVVDAMRKRFRGSGIRFIHVEIYKNNNPSLGTNRFVKEWHLPAEPFTFLVGRDGRIKASFEGSVSVDELAAAVQRYL